VYCNQLGSQEKQSGNTDEIIIGIPSYANIRCLFRLVATVTVVWGLMP